MRREEELRQTRCTRGLTKRPALELSPTYWYEVWSVLDSYPLVVSAPVGTGRLGCSVVRVRRQATYAYQSHLATNDSFLSRQSCNHSRLLRGKAHAEDELCRMRFLLRRAFGRVLKDRLAPPDPRTGIIGQRPDPSRPAAARFQVPVFDFPAASESMAVKFAISVVSKAILPRQPWVDGKCAPFVLLLLSRSCVRFDCSRALKQRHHPLAAQK